MISVNFDEVAEEVLIGLPMKNYIDRIYETINTNKLDTLISQLTNFRKELISHCQQADIRLESYPNFESAKIYFSHFLQHIFRFIQKNQIDKNNKKIILMKVLAFFKQDFFFQFYFNEEKKTTFWVDKLTGDTTLTTAAQNSEHTIFKKLLKILTDTFTLDTASDQVPEDLERYLFYENKLGRSALSLIWMRKDISLENILFQFAEKYYKDKFSPTFRKFLFQVDPDQNTALMRAGHLGLTRVFHSIINNIDRLYGGKNSDVFKALLLFENVKGETLLYELIRGERIFLLKHLMAELVNDFEIIEFRQFLTLDLVKKTTPLIEAIKVRNLKIINELFECSTANFLPGKITHDLLSQQDEAGYTALMRTVEINYTEGLHYFFNTLINLFEYDITALLGILRLKCQPLPPTHRVFSVFQLAARASNWEILEELIDLVSFTVGGSPKLIAQELKYVDETGINVLTKLYREEKAFRLQREQGKRVSSTEVKESSRRLKLARLLVKLGQHSPERSSVPHWISLSELPRVWNRVNDFYSIFCRESRRRSTRSQDICFFSDEDLKASVPENALQISKEALVNLVSIIKQKNLDSIREISVIRNSNSISARESDLLEKYSQIVERFYDAHAFGILKLIKTHTSPSLESAFEANKAHILVDNQQDLLLLERSRIFSGSLFNPIKFLPLDPSLSPNDFKAWFDTYFGSSYTLHPFDPELIMNYPHHLGELTQEPIISDLTLLSKTYEGLTGKTIQDLFLIYGNSISLSNLNELGFFSDVSTWLDFRAERFPDIFYTLSDTEQQALKNFLIKYQNLPAKYSQLSVIENEYLTNFGTKIKESIINYGDITPINLLNAVIDSHEEVLASETTLSANEKDHIFFELRSLKTKLNRYESRVYAKTALQLVVLLLPSVVRGIAKKEPIEFAAPIGFIAADIALSKVLIELTKHPQVLKIFPGELTSKVLSIASQRATRIPIVGSVLMVYGLYQSGKALVSAENNDPNRPYYAHLLMNNLVTASLMGTEIAATLPFWPLLSLFTLLTVDQIATEGARIHEALLHIEDDTKHPLLKFYTTLQLGLGVVNGDIQVILDQRQLFEGFLSYLDKIKSIQGVDALVAVFLPAVRRVAVQEVIENSRLALGCRESARSSLGTVIGSPQPQIYPHSLHCTKSRLVIDNKADYYFSLGQLKTFCEKRDPFYAKLKPDYKLLVGAESADCSLGQPKTIRAIAQADGENAAGILVNAQLKEENSDNYRFFAPIDPRLVKNYQLNFFPKKMSGSDALITDLEEWLPCANDALCITNVRLAIGPLYAQIASDLSEKTKISVNDEELTKFSSDKGVRTIEYLLSISTNVTLERNRIPEQTFAFFLNKHYLKFEHNSLISEKGFQAQLSIAKKLTLDFTDKAWIEGLYEVPLNQKLVINGLKGISDERMAVLNVIKANSFSCNLGQYTELNDQGIQVTIRGNFTDPALEVYRYNNLSSFYHLLKPIENLQIRSNQSEILLFTITDPRVDETVFIEIKVPLELNHKMLNFSGKYRFKDIIFFSRIIMHWLEEGIWKCDLEINASMTNDTRLFDIDALQKQNFDKVSILTKNEKVYKITHYLFCQYIELPIIHGKFVSYRLTASANGWLINLKHVLPNEETKCYIGEKTNEIIIDNIRYQIIPFLATLFGIGTADGTAINRHNLIANLKIEASFFANPIHLKDHIFTIGNLSFERLPSDIKLYFSDLIIPFNYLKYQALLQPSYPITLNLDNLRLDGRQAVESNKLTTNIIPEHSKSRLDALFTVTTFTITGFISGAFFLFIKRFKRNILPALIPTFDLLDIPQASAEPCKQEVNLYNLGSSTFPKLFKIIEHVKNSESNGLSTQHVPSAKYNSDLNTQLFFVNYLLRMCKMKCKKDKIPRENRNTQSLHSFT